MEERIEKFSITGASYRGLYSSSIVPRKLDHDRRSRPRARYLTRRKLRFRHTSLGAVATNAMLTKDIFHHTKYSLPPFFLNH